MTGPLPTDTVLHLAVLSGGDAAGSDTVCAVLAYDGRGHRHLQPVGVTPSAEQLHRYLGGTASAQLQLPIVAELPPPTSAGRCWRTWVLPSVPVALRTLPPDQLAAALADRLLTGVTS